MEMGNFEDALVEEIMLFVKRICLNVILPKLAVAKGNELLQLIGNFWEKLVIFEKL
jgi:hypothetical protein